MAQYFHLPVYKASYDMLIHIMETIKNFQREYRFSIGERIQNEAIELVVSIYKANSNKVKKEYIEQMLEHVQLLYLYIRVAKDLKIMSVEKYAYIIEMVDGIARQAQGWLKSSGSSSEPAQAMV